MAYLPTRFVLTQAAASSPLFTIANGESAIIKNISCVNSGTNQAIVTLSIGTVPVVSVQVVGNNATLFVDCSIVMNAGDSLNLTVTGGSSATAVSTTVSGVRITA